MSFFEFPHTRTYNSDLGWLIKTVTQIAEAYQSLVDWKTTHTSDYQTLERRVTALESEINSFESEIDRRFNQLSTQLSGEIYTQIQTALSVINPMIAELNSNLNAYAAELARLRVYTDSRVDAEDEILKTYVDQKLQDFINSLPDYTSVLVNNPVRGEITTIQVAIDDLYGLGRTDALTAMEYDLLGLTAAEYDALQLTAIEYDQYGRYYFDLAGLIKNPYHYMVSPFSGELVTLETVINELANLHKDDTLTATEYDALDLDASYYDGLLVSAYDYDWHSKTLVA